MLRSSWSLEPSGEVSRRQAPVGVTAARVDTSASAPESASVAAPRSVIGFTPFPSAKRP